MADSNINPVVISSAVIAGAVGATVAYKAKPYVNKAINMTAPVVDTVSVSAKKAATAAENGWSKFAESMEKFIDILRETIDVNLKYIKSLFTKMKNKITSVQATNDISKIKNNLAKTVKMPAITAGIAAGALYTGYKIVNSTKKDN